MTFIKKGGGLRKKDENIEFWNLTNVTISVCHFYHNLIAFPPTFEASKIYFHEILTPQSQINTMEETFQSHLINTTIFQIKSFDVLSGYALLVSCPTCSAYSAVLLCESEKVSQQKKILSFKKMFLEQNNCFAACVAGTAQRDGCA